MDFLFELLVNLAFQALGEIIVSMFPKLAKRFFTETDPIKIIKVFFYFIFGALMGKISLFIHPYTFIHNPTLKIIVLLLSPLITGYAMHLVGKWRIKHNKEGVIIERFSYGFALAFGISLVRYIWAI